MNLTIEEIDLIADRLAEKLGGARTMDTRYLPLKDACKYASVSIGTMKKWIKDGLVAASRPTKTGDWRIDRESIDDLFNMNRY